MVTLIQDVKYAWRMLGRSPGFTAVALLILAGGIGVATTIFSLVNGLLFSPLPYPEADRLVYLWESNARAKFSQAISYPNFLDCQNQTQVLENLALFSGEAVNLSGGGEPERLQGIRVSPEMMRLLGAKLAMGRPFLPEEHAPGSNRVVLLSHGLWQRRLGSNPEILRQTLTLNGEPYVVAGVLAAECKLGVIAGFEPDFWMPLASSESPDRGSRAYLALARLKPGVTLEQARAEMVLLGHRLEQAHPDTNSGWTIQIERLRGAVDPIAYVLLVLLIGSILGIVSVNVANLLLARAAQREKEMAIRAALGATRRRVLRQLLTETLLLNGWGACLGLLLAFGACRLINVMSAGTNLGLVEVRLDARVLLVTLLITLLSGVATGLVPALQMSKVNLNQGLKEGSEGWAAGSSRRRLKKALVISEVALSLVLLNGAALALKSLVRLLRVDPGFRPENVLTMRLSLSGKEYAQKHRQIAFFERLLRRLESRAGVQSAAVASALPTSGRDSSFRIEGRPSPLAGEEPLARLTVVSPGYFRALAAPLRLGRGFGERDVANALPVCIINETAARKHWAGQDPVGMQITVAGATRTIVGVAGDLRSPPLALSPAPEIYVPYAQFPTGEMWLMVQTTLETPLSLAAAVKQEVRAVDAHQPVTRIQTLKKALSANLGVIHTSTSLLGGVALGALFLTAVGVYGVLAFIVSQRTREFGIRLALGARTQDVLKMVLRQGMTPVLLGVIPGLALALALARILSSRVYGLSPAEPFILAGASLLLVMVALAACYFPARRATRVDPIVALRHE